MKKLLSIIVPSYNMEQYLPKCLGSLVVNDAALLQRLDVIVVNDGSKDRTSAIAHEFEKKYPGVFRVIDKPNGHYGSCVNAGLAVAVGAFVKVMDADDSYSTSALVELLNVLAKVDDDVDMVLTDHAFVDGEGHVSPRKPVPLPVNQPLDPSCLLAAYDDIMIWDTAYRTSVLKELGYRQTEGVAYTDMEWVTFPVCKVRKVYHLPVCLYYYLTEREGQSMDPSQLRKSMTMFEKVLVDMVDGYLKQRDEFGTERTAYCRLQLLRQARIVYGMALYRVPVCDVMQRLPVLDRMLRERVKSIYDELARAFMIGPSHKFPVIAVWRTMGGAGALLVNLLRFYVRISKGLSQTRKLVKG